MEEYTVKKSDDILACILKHGFAILEDVLTPDECTEMRNGAWDFFERVCTLLKRDDPSTWNYIFELCPTHDFIYRHWGIGHAQYLWDIRQKPKVISIYRRLWNKIYEYRGTKHRASFMRVSYEGGSFLLPPETTDRGWDGKPWYHLNQRYESIDLRGVQSFVTSEDIKPGDSTLVVLRGSNMKYETSNIRTNTYDKRSLTDFELETIYKDCERIEITCKAGSMVLWDPRTVHYSKGVTKGREFQNLRNLAYLCYVPQEHIGKKIARKRKQAFNDLRTSTNWPEKIELIPILPRKFTSDYFREDLKNYPKVVPQLDEFGVDLI